MGLKSSTINRDFSSQGVRIVRPRHILAPKTMSADGTRTMEVRVKIQLAKQRLGTWDKVAEWLGDSHKKGACQRLGKDETFRPSVSLVKTIEGLPLPPLKISAEVCPSCLQQGKVGIHIAGDCHNAPISAVVILAPGERVTDAAPADAGDPALLLALVERWTAEDALEDGAHVSRETFQPRPPRPRKRYYRPCLPPELEQRINAKRGDMSQAEYIEQALWHADLWEDA